ncbi:glycosyl transferase family 90-domain-containing protein [Lineolata rhizophorae]|uniref:Glycosyl transferase family 90-domain-containing protein n=1 Tax=Lineolata rhizophorae TaxID=578093 RepID=A0A6A6NRX4_9PEZI|nr:glycosyl transferase family 90-domain-containing protein [Lineolata rhizophorae]
MSQLRPRTLIFLSPFIFVVFLTIWLWPRSSRLHVDSPIRFPSQQLPWEFSFHRDGNRHNLTHEQCDQAFPELYASIERSVAPRMHDPIQLEELDIPPGKCMVRAMIYDGELYIIDRGHPENCCVLNARERIPATLNLIQRALVASPEQVPNIEFVLSVDDLTRRSTQNITWGYSRKDEDSDVWLVPDYGYWSWYGVDIPSFNTLHRKIEALNGAIPWREKIQKAVWRGTVQLAQGLRGKLLEVADGKEWSDVKEFKMKQENKTDYISLPDHCQYQYVLMTEGTSYSGRAKFLLLCNSVLVSHELKWNEFTTHLMEANGPNQNFIQTESDWSDLEETMGYYLSHPEDAEVIARRSYDLFGRRYHTPAAVSCYLRRLFAGWSQVQGFDVQFTTNSSTGEEVPRGLPYEAFSVSFPFDRTTDFKEWPIHNSEPSSPPQTPA